MGKKHDFGQVTLWIGGKQINPNATFRLRYRLGYSVKHDGAAVSTDYSHIFDLETTVLKGCEHFKNDVTVRMQNGNLRPLSESTAKSKYPRDKELKYEDVFPGKRRTVTKDMSPSEIREKCKSDPTFRAALMAELMEMGDNNE